MSSLKLDGSQSVPLVQSQTTPVRQIRRTLEKHCVRALLMTLEFHRASAFFTRFAAQLRFHVREGRSCHM